MALRSTEIDKWEVLYISARDIWQNALPEFQTGAQLTFDTPDQQKNSALQPTQDAAFTAPGGESAYLPDLILVQLRVISRWAAFSGALMAYSFAFTSSDG